MSEHVEISKRLMLINSASAVINRIIGLTVLVWLQQYLITRISPDEYAIYRVVMALIVFLPLLSLIVGGALGRYITEAYARGDFEGVTRVASTAFPYCFGAGVLVLLGGGVCAWFIDGILDIPPEMVSDARIMFALMSFMAAARVACLPLSAGLHVRQKFVWMHLIGLGSEVIRIGVLFALLFGVSTRALWVVVATAPGSLIGLFVTCMLSLRLVPALRPRRDHFQRELASKLLAFGGWLLANRIATNMREVAGPVLLNRVANAAQVASFSLGVMVEVRLFQSALGPIQTAQPALTALYATGQEERLRRYYFRISRYVLWAFLFLSLPMIVYRHELLTLYLAESYQTYVATATVMALILGRAVFVYPQPVLAQVALAKNRTKDMAIRGITVEALSISMMALFVIVFEMGAVGAALGLFLSSAIGVPALHWRFGLQLTGAKLSSWVRKTLVPGLLPALAAVPLSLAAQYFLPPDTWLELGLQAGLCWAVFGGAVFLCLDDGERADVSKVVGRLRARLRPS